MRKHLPDALAVVALSLIVLGVALVSVAVALIVAGLGLGGAAFVLATEESRKQRECEARNR